jgi:hypothetical protein
MNLRAALKSQYHAALIMLKQVIERCPDDLWTAGGHPSAYWQIAYHTLFFTHFYLQPDLKAFRPWERARKEYECLEEVYLPPHGPPKLGEPYTKADVLDYWRVCNEMIDAGVDALDLDAPQSGFPWYDMTKLDHQLVNIRHIQHHTGQLDDRLRLAGREIEWIGGKRSA